jgi:hypothetical protein
VGPSPPYGELVKLLEDFEKLQTQKDTLPQTRDDKLDKHLRNPELTQMVTNRLVALARAIATYLDGSGATFSAPVDCKMLQVFFDALALNASHYERPGSKSGHLMKFQRQEFARAEKKIDRISTDDYLDSFSQFTIREKSPYEQASIYVSPDESSQSLTGPLKRRNSISDVMDDEEGDRPSSSAGSPVRPRSPARRDNPKEATVAPPKPKTARPAKRSLETLYGNEEDDDASSPLPLGDSSSPPTNEPPTLPTPIVTPSSLRNEQEEEEKKPSSLPLEPADDMDVDELEYPNIPITPMVRYQVQLETIRARLYDSERARKSQRVTDKLLASPGSSSSRASSSSREGSSSSSSSSEKPPNKKDKQ